MAFTEAQMKALFADATSKAQGLGIFDRVSGHEPVSKPGSGLSYAIVSASIRAVTSSGLSEVTCVITLHGRIYASRNRKPADDLDPKILAAACGLMNAYAGGFTLGGTVREVDLLGQFGQPLECQLGYTTQEEELFRVGEIPIPIVVDDLFAEVA